MDLVEFRTLGDILKEDELPLVPEIIQNKFTEFLQKFSDEFCKQRAAASRLADIEVKNEELKSQLLDNQVKFTNFEQNVLELRTQLDQLSAENGQLLQSVKDHDQNVDRLRKERAAAIEERDTFLKITERQSAELERLKSDVQTYQQQLRAAITAKCESIARLDEIQSKEVALDIKERRLESERSMLQKEIHLLSSDLNRSNADLQNIRREHNMNVMHMEVRLKEKTDELAIVKSQNVQYSKSVEELNKKVEELTESIYQHKQATDKFVTSYKKELSTKEKLIDLYKNTEIQNMDERNELLRGIADLKRMLQETTDNFGELETRSEQLKDKHAEEIAELNKTIEALKTELAHANDLLREAQEQSLESAICKLAPTAAVASRLMRSDMSLTELYSLYAKTSEDLEVKNRENSQLQLQLNSILEEINERAPLLKKQDTDHVELQEAHNVLLQQRDELLEKITKLEQDLDQSQCALAHCTKENSKFKQGHTDLSRQVCLLLDELNCMRAGVTRTRSAQQPIIITNSNDAISRDLVTFDSITEMQAQNIKLLTLIRELTTELEANEARNDEIRLKDYEEKFEKATNRLTEMDKALTQKNSTISTLIAKCERYKQFYFDAQKKLGSQIIDLDDSTTLLIDESQLDQTKAAENAAQLEVVANLERRIRSLELQLEDESKKYASLKENYDYYTSEKRKNDALVQEQLDSMRKEVRELTSANCKLMNSNEFQSNQLEMLQKSIGTYKQQITALEGRTKNYEVTIIKHEQTILMLKDEIMSSHRKQVESETKAHNLMQENRVLKDTSNRLQAEKEAFHREQHNQTLLLNNLEFIKTNLERSETEGRLRLEQRYDDAIRELAAQRRHFQEKEEKFRETVNEFKRQTETATKLKEEERQHAEKWHQELLSVREELTAKVNQVNDLSKKLQESLTPSKDENPIMVANKKSREFQLKYEQARVDIESLTVELAKVREHGDQFYKMSQAAESEIKNMHDMHAEVVSKLEEEIKRLKNSEAELQTRLTDLEAELMLSNVSEKSKDTNQSDQLKLAQEELKTVLEKLTEAGRTIRALRAENSTLAESINSAEVKYANEMVLHSSDIQELTKVKAEFLKVQDELTQLKSGRESLQAAHDELKKANAEAQALIQQEKDESEKRVEDLNALNASLHDQIEALTSKLAALAQSAGNQSVSAILSDSLNESGVTAADQLNSSMGVDESKSSEQLLKIIKFLRKEKDLYAAKLDIMKAENARLVSEHTIQQKKVDELNVSLKQERSKSETDVVSASKHEAVLRKIETLNAITDSNRILREERNTLTKRVAELTERISSVEKELLPLQCNNNQLTSKVEELNVENTSLRTEAMRWRQRANALVEKSNRNPEEFKRLQAEREHLAKLLTAEKESNKKQLDELSALKARLDTELPALNRNLQAQDEARKKQLEEVNTLKQTNTRQAQDIMELKNRLLQKEEELLKAQEDIEAKERVLQEKDSKEQMLRKLAKRYKDHYMGLQAQTSGTDTVAELEKVRTELDEVNGTLRSTKEQHEQLQKEHDELKSRSNGEQENESKKKVDQLMQELMVTKTELANQETILSGTKTSYDETVQRLEKELQDAIANHKEVNARLLRENESLHMRINQLQRQLGSQQSTKPSTSTVGMGSEKGNNSESSPRTANVKPMSGSATVQQSATVTPWRGGETPLASIRPISVQNSRTAAILPTSQQQQPGASTSTSTSTSTSSAAASASGSSSSSSSSSAVANTALVPPQQQVHTTGSATLESIASSSPTSSHTDYMPSTSSAAVAVAAIPPMGASAAAESSQEAESVQHPQQNDAQLFVGGAQQQVVALVSPRVEGSSSSSSSSSTTTTSTSTQNQTVPNVQEASNQQQQPSTSGSSSSSSTVVSSHSRHTPSSSNVTTTQAGCSKRPRDVEGDSSTSNAEDGVPEKILKLGKRMRPPMHGGELSAGHIGDSGMDVDQMPTSSQRDQEDEIQVVDSDDEEDVLGPIDGGDAEQEEGYEDSYEQDNEMEDNEGVEAPDQHNEVDIEQVQIQAQAESQLLEDAPAAVSRAQENNQSQAITSGSGESNTLPLPPAEANWKQSPSTSTSAAAARRTESSVEIVSSPQVSNFSEQDTCMEPEVDGTVVAEAAAAVVDESAAPSADCPATVASSPQKPSEVAEQSSSTSFTTTTTSNQAAETKEKSDEGETTAGTDNVSGEADEAFAEETVPAQPEESQQLSNENPNVGTSQSAETENQGNPAEGPLEENEGTDGVSSEGEKPAVEVEEEGREAEATSPSENTRFRTLRSAVPNRRGGRMLIRGNNNSNNNNNRSRIVWNGRDMPSGMRGHPGSQGNQDQHSPGGVPNNNNRVFSNRARGRRPMRRPGPNNFNAGGGYQ